MDEQHTSRRNTVPLSPEHPAGWTLELYAEEALPGDEGTRVGAHVRGCLACSSEVESFRSLFREMATLPQLSPSFDFSDAVMARVKITPHHSPVYAWLLRWLPSTRRGWALLLGLAMAPALPIILLVAWVISNPMVTPAGLWSFTTDWLRDGAWSLLVGMAGRIVESDTITGAQALVNSIFALPAEILLGAGLMLGIGIPLSVWVLYRTLRTPTRGSMYAH
jgi:hypothetical protein